MIMDKLRSFLLRHRDQTNVTYSRFGRPGEEADDKPPPSQITVAPFDENSPKFILFNWWHISKAAAAVACFGLSIVILSFISAFLEFNWVQHDRGVDISALLFMFAYLTIGVLIHYYVLQAIKKQNAYYLIPFIVIYTAMCAIEFIVILSLLFKMLEVHPSNQHQPFWFFVLGTSVSVGVQFLMLMVVVRCRQYISAKTLHDMEMRVAELSKKQYPAIQIVVSESGSGAGITNPNATTTNAFPAAVATSATAAGGGTPQNGSGGEPTNVSHYASDINRAV